MAVSYGAITIVDNTDLGQLNFQLSANTVKQQQRNINNTPPTYFPDWNGNNPLTITPLIFYDGSLIEDFTDSRILNITWYHTAYNATNPNANKISTTTTTNAEYVSGNKGQYLNRTVNMGIVDALNDAAGRKYIAVLNFKPINTLTNVLQAIAEIDFSLTEYGHNGDAAKSLQLIGDGSHFIYQYTGDLINNTPITLTAQKQHITNINWWCDNQLIYADSNNRPTLTVTSTPYTASTLSVVGQATTNYTKITDLSSNFTTNKEAQFKVAESDGNGIAITNGFEDYFSIYKIDEASPGTSTYTAYLDNDNETISIYDGQLDFTNAISTFNIEKGGVDDISNWIIEITKTEGLSWDTGYPAKSDNNTGPYNNKVKIGGMITNTGRVTFNATKGYEPSEDTTVDPNKTYYTRSVQNSAYVYTEQANPSGNPSTNHYYEALTTPLHQTKQFTLSKNPSLISHSLRLNSVNATRTSSNAYSPENIVVSAITRTGGAGTVDYTDAGVLALCIHPVSGSAVWKEGLTPPYTIDLDNVKNSNNQSVGAIQYIEVFLGGTNPGPQSDPTPYSNAEDKQTITISQIPDESWQVNLRETYDSISTNYSYVVSNTKTYEIPFDVFKGITLQTIKYPNANHNNYPCVVATWTGDGAATTTTIVPQYFNNNTQVTTVGNTVNKIKYTVTNNGSNSTNIGQEGTITLTFYIDSTHSVVKTYKYKAMPEALDAMVLRVQTIPRGVFHNQEGYLYAQPMLIEGSEDVIDNDNITGKTYTWYYYDGSVGDWVKIKNWSNSTGEGTYYNGLAVGLLDTTTTPEWTFSKTNSSGNIQNGSTNSKFLRVQGSIIDGYGCFKLEFAYTLNNTLFNNTEYINFTDASDPIQVSVVSTLGKEILNGQGVGAIYVRVNRSGEEVDPIVYDNYLGVGVGSSTPPTNNNYLGFIMFDNTQHATNGNKRYYTATYYARESTSSDWKRRETNEQQAQYTWTFRDFNNVPITTTSIGSGGIHANVHESIKYLVANSASYHPQFVYLDANVIEKRITAQVKVEL